MLNIKSILEYIRNNINNTKRFRIVDEEHLVDNFTGVKLHLYDDYFKVSRGDTTVATSSDFTPEEQEILWEIKKSITPAATVEAKTNNRLALLKARRSSFSKLYETPEPLFSVEEEETTPYTG